MLLLWGAIGYLFGRNVRKRQDAKDKQPRIAADGKRYGIRR